MGLIFVETNCKLSQNFISSISSTNLVKALESIQEINGVTFQKRHESITISGDWDNIKNAHTVLEKFYQPDHYSKYSCKKFTEESYTGVGATDESNTERKSYANCPNDKLSSAKDDNNSENEYDKLNDTGKKNRIQSTDAVTISPNDCQEPEENEYVDYLMDDDTDIDEQYQEDVNSCNVLLDDVQIKQEIIVADKTCNFGEFGEFSVATNSVENIKKQSVSYQEKDFIDKFVLKVKKEIFSESDDDFYLKEASQTESKENAKDKAKEISKKQLTCIPKNQTYSCKICNKTYKRHTYRTYKKHIQTCKGRCGLVKEFKCEKCDYCGNSEKRLSEHVERMHQNRLACGTCFKQFGLHKELQRHVRTVHLAQGYRCNICGKAYKVNSIRRYKKHMLAHSENQATFSDLTFGIDPSNQNPESKVKIENVLESQADLNNSKKQAQMLEKPSYRNEDNDMEEDSVTDSEMNMSHAQPNNMKAVGTSIPLSKSAFYCLFCDKSYESSRKYRKHMSEHKEDYVDLKFECGICHKSFSTKELLSAHTELHPMKKSFKCQVCNKEFKQKSHLTEHKETHNEFKRYVCHTCGKAFKTKSVLKIHMKTHGEIKGYACHVCAKTFKLRPSLYIHLKIHTETRDHICPTCGKGFIQKGSLNRHERIHSGVKPFQCAVCSRSFNDYSIIRRHMIMLHKRDKDPSTWQSDVIRTNIFDKKNND